MSTLKVVAESMCMALFGVLIAGLPVKHQTGGEFSIGILSLRDPLSPHDRRVPCGV